MKTAHGNWLGEFWVSELAVVFMECLTKTVNRHNSKPDAEWRRGIETPGG
jgi:hypothetical protein